MLVDLDLRKKRAVILGGGIEAELKAAKLLDAGASIVVIADRPTFGLKTLSRKGELKLVKQNPRSAAPILKTLRPKVVFISTGKAELDEELADAGRSSGSLVCVVDAPRLNDFNMPAIARLGPVRVAISSGGKSPAVVKILRKRIEAMIGHADLLQVELQYAVKKQIRDALKTPAARKKMVYEIIADREVVRLLNAGDLRRAKVRASRMIRDRKSRQVR